MPPEKEEVFTRKIANFLETQLPNNEVTIHSALRYSMIIGPEIKLLRPDYENPRHRDGESFETDILVSEKKPKTPLVVIETKRDSPTPHDVIIYSTKAVNHKRIYPYLRYGLLFKGKRMAALAFHHNVGFDFMYAMNDADNANELNGLLDIVQSQMEASKKLQKVLKNSNVKRYVQKVEMEDA